MSMKSTSAESNADEQQNEGSDSLLQQGNYAKHAKLTSLSDTTLQDLPMELIELILIKVVAMEVKGTKLAKSVWKEKADLVINRLRTVCSYWSSILTTDFFRNELHRTLDTTGQQKIRLEILHQSQIPFKVLKVTTMKDEIFLFSHDMNIIVYNRSNMERLKDVVAPPGTFFMDIAGCNVSTCVYVLGKVVNVNDHSILRLTKDEEHQFGISPWIDSSSLPYLPSISVSANGSLIIFSYRQGENPAEASIYDANGHLQHKIMMLPGIYGFQLWDNAILKSNGNLVLVFLNNRMCKELSEFDVNGNIERKYQSPVLVKSGVYSADISGRYVINELGDGIKLLDCEFNLLDFTGPQLNASILHYSSERNEVVSTLSVGFWNNSSVLTIFRFTEE